MKKENFIVVTRLLNYFMIFLMVFAVFVLTLLPKISRWYANLELGHYSFPQTIFWYVNVILYISGICAIIILNELRKLFKSCSDDNPFEHKNVKSLKIISIASGIISVVFATKIFVINSFLTLIVVFVFIIATIFAYVLAELFENAVNYKYENDLTI